MGRRVLALCLVLAVGTVLASSVAVAGSGTAVPDSAPSADRDATASQPPRTELAVSRSEPVVAGTGASSAAGTSSDDVRLVPVGAGDDRLWPFTSRSTSFDGRTLVINGLVTADPETTRRILEWRTPTEWERNATDPSTGALPEPIRWQSTHGAIRYTYVERASDGEGRWLPQRYQLHTGTYLGTRHHVRAFAPSGATWTALQAHSEYWDWFRLRHTVTDVRGTASVLESDFEARHGFNVDRAPDRAAGRLERGPVVVSAALGFVMLTLSQTPARRFRRRVVASRPSTVVLAVALAVPLAVRWVGIWLEQVFPWVPPTLFAAMLFPVLTVGLPVAVVRAATDGSPTAVGIAATAGVATSLILDLALLGVVPPAGLMYHRGALAVGLGVLAVGGTGRAGADRAVLALGAVLWTGALVVSLFGVY